MEIAGAFVIGVASSIVGKMISRLVEDESPSISRREIQQEVSRAVEATYGAESKLLVRRVVREVIEEIRFIAARHPTVTLNRSDFNVLPPSNILEEEEMKKEIDLRLRHLRQVIKERRSELGESTSSVGAQGHGAQGHGIQTYKAESPATGQLRVSRQRVPDVAPPQGAGSVRESALQEAEIGRTMIRWAKSDHYGESCQGEALPDRVKEMLRRIEVRRQGGMLDEVV